jgi:hypothetical protein
LLLAPTSQKKSPPSFATAGFSARKPTFCGRYARSAYKT